MSRRCKCHAVVKHPSVLIAMCPIRSILHVGTNSSRSRFGHESALNWPVPTASGMRLLFIETSFIPFVSTELQFHLQTEFEENWLSNDILFHLQHSEALDIGHRHTATICKGEYHTQSSA